jgi:phosphatidylinositol N-acetylglucosaminyltransferase subunit A
MLKVFFFLLVCAVWILIISLLELVEKLTEAITQVKNVVPQEMHEELKAMYDWNNVAERTEKVYQRISGTADVPLIERLKRFMGCGLWAGKINCMVAALDYLIWRFLDWTTPAEDIDMAFDFPCEEYASYLHKR